MKGRNNLEKGKNINGRRISASRKPNVLELKGGKS